MKGPKVLGTILGNSSTNSYLKLRHLSGNLKDLKLNMQTKFVIYIYIYIKRERERERERERPTQSHTHIHTHIYIYIQCTYSMTSNAWFSKKYHSHKESIIYNHTDFVLQY